MLMHYAQGHQQHTSHLPFLKLIATSHEGPIICLSCQLHKTHACYRRGDECPKVRDQMLIDRTHHRSWHSMYANQYLIFFSKPASRQINILQGSSDVRQRERSPRDPALTSADPGMPFNPPR